MEMEISYKEEEGIIMGNKHYNIIIEKGLNVLDNKSFKMNYMMILLKYHFKDERDAKNELKHMVKECFEKEHLEQKLVLATITESGLSWCNHN
eukprot:11585386-Ditylum_brightwellii.AAC.1